MAQGLFNLKQVVQAVQQGGWPAQKPPAVEYLVVAGGGGGGQNSGGGGAGGGVLQGTDPIPNGQTLLVTVGSGGAGGNGGSGNGVIGQNSVFGLITATGGGYGGYNALPGGAGGSGGGGGAGSTSFANQFIAPGQGTANQGNAGGSGLGGGSGGQAGGGGGAGAVGLNAPVANIAGNGGGGIASAISGTVTSYAGGGGGGTYPNTSAPGIAGQGGGGAGASVASAAGSNGTANTGGGGGGGAGGSGIGGTGGSGIVIVSYPDVYAAPTATTGSPTVSTSGSGSFSLNGANQYVTYPSNSVFDLGSSNFTIEMWVYKTVLDGGVLVTQARSDLAPSLRTFSIGFGGGSNNLWVASVWSGSTEINITSSATLTINTWYHVALVRNSTVMTLYVNGTSVGSVTVAGSINAGTNPLTLGRLGDYNGYYSAGYISNFRYEVGTALYTSSFTPSTTPLAFVTGTKLLLNTVTPSVFNDSGSGGFVPTPVNSPTWNAASPFTVTGYKNRVYTWTSSGSITF